MVETNSIDQIYSKYLEKKLAHAFLIETNNIDFTFLNIIKLVKKLSCFAKYQDNCDKCNICSLIDNNNLPSLQVIEPDGSKIKKEQILELKNKFKYKPIYTENNIYIIKNAEKLNESSANTMLKFLEEPNINIIGFFLTSSRDNVISTIKSRCQVYTNNYEKKEVIEKYEEIEEIVYNYILNFEKSITNGLLYNKEISSNENIIKNNINDLFLIISSKYKNILSKKLDNNKDLDRFDFLIETNDIVQIIQKTKVIEETISKLVYNINIELLLDKFVIEMGKYNA